MDEADALQPSWAVGSGLFARLRGACIEDWRAYTRHPFIRRLAEGTLPEEAFRHMLVQDYLCLTHFARAYGLAVYKAERIEEIHRASTILGGILEKEMRLHLDYCREWGIDPAALAATPEASETIAYTRFLLERGTAGDLLDLHVAMAPCVVGYAEIAEELAVDPSARLEGNPYRAWIEMYASDEYREVAEAEAALLDRLGAERGGIQRFASLKRTFETACRLEAGFWRMGLVATS